MTARTATLTISGQLTHVPRLRHWLQDVLSAWAVSSETIAALALAVTEICTNIIRHGYRDVTAGNIKVCLAKYADALHVTILDTAPEFIPPQVALPSPDLLAEGGFGLFLIAALLDEIRYERVGEHGNRTILVKYDIASSREL